MLSMIWTGTGQNQNTEVEQQQRALFIFNSSQQVIWPSIAEIDTFIIGVMGSDPIIQTLNQMAIVRRIYGKSVEIKRINSIDEIDNLHIIYANQKNNFNTQSILKTTQHKQILLITEGYDYNSSMINMVRVDGSFKYEINKQLFKKANLNVTSSLETFAIASFDKWRDLYKDSEEKLSKVEEQNEFQKEIIELQLKEIASKEDVIVEKNYSIKNLTVDGVIKDIELKKRIAFANELEKNIAHQLEQIATYKEDIKTTQNELDTQKKVLEQQNTDIAEKQKILNEKTIIISNQKKNNILLLFFLGTLLIASLLIYRAFINNKKLNKRLEFQHSEISKQSNLLESKNKELEQFAYIASHDLQEPLNTVSSFIDLIKTEYHDKFDHDGKESLGFIKEASLRMKKLIDGLLQYSRLGRGSDYTDVNCIQIIDEIKADLKIVIAENKAEIHHANLPLIWGNEIELRLLFQNLISNSIKFSKINTPPIIHINSSYHKNTDNTSTAFWKFIFTDNGIGIPDEHKDRIFGIFQRLHKREDFQGSGIGLAHCKKIVESHGGKIWLESEVSKGSSFYITIPDLKNKK